MKNSRVLILEKAVLDGMTPRIGKEVSVNSRYTYPFDKTEPLHIFRRSSRKVTYFGEAQVLRQKRYGTDNQHLSIAFRYLGKHKKR